MNMELIVHVPVGSAHVGDVEADEIAGLLERISAGAFLADFLINHVICEDQRAA
jgi:hypothetical protein